MKIKVIRFKQEGSICRSEFPISIKSEMDRYKEFLKEKKENGTFIETFETYI